MIVDHCGLQGLMALVKTLKFFSWGYELLDFFESSYCFSVGDLALLAVKDEIRTLINSIELLIY